MAHYDPDFPLDDEAGEMLPVFILASRPGAPVTINHPMYRQIVVSQEEAWDIALALVATASSGRTIDHHVRKYGNQIVLTVERARQAYTPGEALTLSQQISAALQVYRNQHLQEVA
ncbi:MAG: hypothetical protein ABFD83_04890 [Armatimonadota bacterium]